ncbi:MAG: hypothetical protein IJ946_07025 [Clostridia bacterium]|nr:hypothetical protein [Clostridia bacterium]
MIKIENNVIKNTYKFWNHCLFHPTDAIEDPWGKRIIDRFAEDKSMGMIRIYAMLEDIVYTDEDGNLLYDFRINDLRLDYLVEKGFDLLIAYASMPSCIAENNQALASVSKNKTRYKGKMFNTSRPKDYALWEEVCYQYTKHLIERYGIERVKNWRMQCFNEPDMPSFFMLDYKEAEYKEFRAKEYAKLYEYFEKGVRKASEEVVIGGPAIALASNVKYLEILLNSVKEKNLKMDFISIHTYGTGPLHINKDNAEFTTDSIINVYNTYKETIKKCGFEHLPIIIDEWGMSTHGYFNVEECPKFMDRETEVFSAYFTKLIHAFLANNITIDKLMICLSGQHEMITDFSGFRNFFTLNFIAKPIYNAYLMSSRLFTNFLKYDGADENTFVLPTTDENGKYSIMLTYCSKYFKEDIPEKQETLVLPDEVKGKKVTVYCIDKENTNPYRLYQRNGYGENMSEEEIKILRKEGKIKPIKEFTAQSTEINLKLTANCVYLIAAE